MYDKSLVKITISKIETAIEFRVEFKHFNSMVLVIFLFLVMAFDETLEDEWTATGLRK